MWALVRIKRESHRAGLIEPNRALVWLGMKKIWLVSDTLPPETLSSPLRTLVCIHTIHVYES